MNNYAVGHWMPGDIFMPALENIIHDLAGQGKSYPSLKPITYKEARELADMHNENAFGFRPKTIVIVLTVSHTDHDVKNNDMGNLKLLCQKHHNQHDVHYRKHNRKFKGTLPLL